jgi:hypothetical protein
MMGIQMFGTVIGLFVGGIIIGRELMKKQPTGLLALGIFLMAMGTGFMGGLIVHIMNERNTYYQERVPNLKELIIEYDINQLENKILELKEK